MQPEFEARGGGHREVRGSRRGAPARVSPPHAAAAEGRAEQLACCRDAWRACVTLHGGPPHQPTTFHRAGTSHGIPAPQALQIRSERND